MKKSVRSSNHVFRVCISFTFLMLFILSVFQLQAQQNPYPFSLDLSFGGGLIGNPDINTTFQPELGFSYMPGRFGVGLNAGLLSYDPTFDAQQYTAGFGEYTSISGSDEKWSSFFLSLGPRFEFGSSLPVTFHSSLDLSLSYNSPPSISVDFNDPDGTAPGLDLQLSGFEAGEDYTKWSAAIRPEFQMQFSPGGSDRFAITVATGVQYRLSQNEFKYSQRDLSGIRVLPNSQEMFMQFEMAPEVQRTAQPPQTNFFTTVGLKIKFGKVKHLHDEGVIHRDIASRASSDGIGSGDCDDSSSDRCIKPGERSSNDADADGIDDSTERGEVCEDDGNGNVLCGETNHFINHDPDNENVAKAISMARLIRPPNVIIAAGQVAMMSNPYFQENSSEGEMPVDEGQANDGDSDNNDNEDPLPSQRYGMQPSSYCVEIGSNALQGKSTEAQDYNSSRSNKQKSIANDTGDGDTDSDDDGIDDTIETAQDYNSSRSNKPNTIADIGDVDGDGFPDLLNNASFSISKRSARTGRSQSPIYEGEEKSTTNPLYKGEEMGSGNGGDLDGDGFGYVDGLHFDLEIDDLRSEVSKLSTPNNTEEPSVRSDTSFNAPPGVHLAPSQISVIVFGLSENGDNNPLGESATYSISKRSARTGRSESQENPLAKESGWQETPQLDIAPPNNVHQWTYDLKSLAEGQDIPGGTLTVLFTGGSWHFDLQVDPLDMDDDALPELLQNSSFSISKRSARTGRN